MKKKPSVGAGPDMNDPLRFAAVIAHQLKSPIGAADTVLRTLLGELAGPLAPRQKDLLERADTRLQEALETVRRLLSIVRKERGVDAVSDAAAIVRHLHQQWLDEAGRRDIGFSTDVRIEPAFVRVGEDSITEALRALIENALKYTPRHGQVRLLLTEDEADGAIRIAVGDSGPGVAEDQRARIFEPFHRGAPAAQGSTPGVGLGLSFVKALVDGAGGSVTVGASDLGGAEFVLRFAAGEAPAPAPAEGRRLRVVIVGGVAAGPKVASKVIRLRPDTEVTIVDRGELLSYAGCGLPYYISGVVRDRRQLVSTPLGAVRDPVFFQNVRNVTALNRTSALEIDRAGRRVRVRDLERGVERWVPYDKLVLATGARPVVPDLPGRALERIYTLHGVRDAEGIRQFLAEGRAMDVVLVGGGLIGVEMTQALAARGCRVTIVEKEPRILGILDWEMARLLERHLESNGVRVMTGVRVTGFVGEGVVRAVATDRGEIPADLVVLAAGVRAETTLAGAAGLAVGPTGGLVVDNRMCTSDPDIYAAGDCVECRDLLTGLPTYVPLGSTANKQGRVAAVNLCGGSDSFPGILGTVICNVFSYGVGRTGMNEAEAREAGHDVITVLSAAPDREHFLPEAKLLMIKLVVDRGSRRLLGVQTLGPGHGDKRIDVAATAITAGMTVDQIAHLDLGYAPPFAPAMDNLITACNIARNKIGGCLAGIPPDEARRVLAERRETILLDVSSPREYEEMRIPGSRLIPLGSLRGRLREFTADAEIIVCCRNSIRGYEASLILRAAGLEKVRVLDGGVAMWPFERLYGAG
jgi:NADPH-dependent 2,4-dienoyl-CoA reductase/sulfur reductase-like enzyme/rhodanese-related sulfurtransferase/two-component sensor histidine kinase